MLENTVLIFDLIIFVLQLAAILVIAFVVFMFALGSMHGYLKNKLDAFGNGASKQDIEDLREELRRARDDKEG